MALEAWSLGKARRAIEKLLSLAPPTVRIKVEAGTRGKLYWLGSHRWLEERNQETTDVHAALEQRSDADRSVVVIGTDDHVCGFTTLADGVRADSKSAVTAPHAAGIERVAMLTGDNQGTAAAIAAKVGIDDVRAELLPADKVIAVEALEREHGPVAMLGDGVNDAPALARSSLGIAMGVMGTDVAVETADIALMTDDMRKLAWLIEHAKRTLGIIRQNTTFALGIKALFVVLTFTGIASLWGAIAADQDQLAVPRQGELYNLSLWFAEELFFRADGCPTVRTVKAEVGRSAT